MKRGTKISCVNMWKAVKKRCSCIVRLIVLDRVAGEIIRLVASVCVSVRLSVGALLFEPFDL